QLKRPRRAHVDAERRHGNDAWVAVGRAGVEADRQDVGVAAILVAQIGAGTPPGSEAHGLPAIGGEFEHEMLLILDAPREQRVARAQEDEPGALGELRDADAAERADMSFEPGFPMRVERPIEADAD